MTKKMRSLLSLVMSVVMLGSMVGCNQPSSKPNSSTPDEGTSSSAPADSSSPEDSSSEEEIVEIPTIVDECEYVEGADRLADDVYGYNVSKSDLGFGEDSRFSNRLSPTSAPKVWEGAYAQYNLGGQNVIRVVAAEAPEAEGKLDPVFIYTNKGRHLTTFILQNKYPADKGLFRFPGAKSFCCINQFGKVCIACICHFGQNLAIQCNACFL